MDGMTKRKCSVGKPHLKHFTKYIIININDSQDNKT